MGRLYTGIHALKPKPKLKTGAICESTTDANNQATTNTSVRNVDQKNALVVSGVGAAGPHFTSLLTPSNTMKEVGGSAATPVITALKKEGGGGSIGGGLIKVPADKKKIDARKKSLKRL